MIPIILQISDTENREEHIDRIAKKTNIKENHRLYIKPEKDELLLQDIKHLKTYCSQSYVDPILITLVNVDRSSEEVQNSLLKILEEESHRFLFLLIVHNYHGLLSTIQSRCTLSNHISVKHAQSSKQMFSLTANIYKTMNTYSKSTKEDVIGIIDSSIETILEFGVVRKKDLLQRLLLTRSHILNNNVNPILGLDTILFFLSKQV